MSSKLLIDSFVTIVTRFAGKTANLLVFVVLARKLTIAEFGLYGYVATMALLLATVLDFGTRHSIGYYYPKMIGREPLIKLQASIWTALFSIVGAAGFGIYLYRFVPDFDALNVVVPACLVMPGMLALRIEQGVLLGQGRIKEYNKSEAWPRTLLLAFTAAAFLFDLITVQVALWSMALAYLISALRVIAYNMVPIRVIRSIAWRDFFDTALQILRRGLKYFPGIVLMVAAKRVNVVIVQDTLGAEGMGAYYGVMRLGEVVTEVALAVGIALFSHNVRHSETDQAVLETAKISRISMSFLGMVSIVALALAEWILPLALGSEYSPYVGLFRVAIICTLAGALWNLLTPVLYASVNPTLTFWLFLPGFLSNLGLAILLVPRFGVLGAAYSLLTAQLLTTTLYLIVFYKKFKISPANLLFINKSDMAMVYSLARDLPDKIMKRASKNMKK